MLLLRLALAVLVLSWPLAARAASADWPTFAHDQQRTGFQATSGGLTRARVSGLRLRWAFPLAATVWASPIVVGDTVFVATAAGDVHSLRASDGSPRWRTHVGYEVRATPAFADGRLFVAVYGDPERITHVDRFASLQALDPRTGRVLWRTPLPGVARAEPVILNGVVYMGTAGGDGGVGCANGRIVALDERTGAPVRAPWFTSPKPQNGGGIWDPISTDGTAIYFGTGNTCDWTGYSDTVTSLTPRLRVRWVHRAEDETPYGSAFDEDIGGGAMVLGDGLYVESKDGFLYAFARRNGARRWSADLHPDGRGGGGYGTPTGDGTMLAVSSGDGSSETPPSSTKLIAFDLRGHRLYDLGEHVASTPALTASFVRGVGFTALDTSLVAFDARTGALLWRYPTEDAFYGAPAIAHGAVFAVDYSGNVYAFGLGGAAAGAPLAPLVRLDHDGVKPLIPPYHLSARRLAAMSGAALLVVVLAFRLARRVRAARDKGNADGGDNLRPLDRSDPAIVTGH